MDQHAPEVLERGMAYFDASAWNALTDHPDREALISALQQRQAVILGSVISAAEILKTPLVARREALSRTMLALLGSRALLEHPLTLVKAAAESFLHGDRDVLLKAAGPGRTLRAYLSEPNRAEVQSIEAWLGNLERNLERFRASVEPEVPSSTCFYAPEVLRSDAFLELLLKLPPAVDLGLTLAQVRGLCDRTDVWRALAGTLAAVIAQVLTRSPKRRRGHKRPGAADLWQGIYLGVVEVFVTGDSRQTEAVCQASAVLQHPRCVVSVTDFLLGVDPAQALVGVRCPVCGCSVRPSTGPARWTVLHARVTEQERSAT